MQPKKYQPICLVCNPETCDVAGCDKLAKFLSEEASKIRAELKSFMDVKT